jgi:hypothetical protein
VIWSFRTPHRTAAALLLAGTFLILVGCAARLTGTVTGTVKYKGAAVAAGTVNFYNPGKGNASQAVLDSSGSFTLPGSLEEGTYKVYVNPPIPEQLPPGQAPKKAPRLDLPPKYQDPGQTPVTREVKAGPNNFTIDLE